MLFLTDLGFLEYEIKNALINVIGLKYNTHVKILLKTGGKYIIGSWNKLINVNGEERERHRNTLL